MMICHFNQILVCTRSESLMRLMNHFSLPYLETWESPMEIKFLDMITLRHLISRLWILCWKLCRLESVRIQSPVSLWLLHVSFSFTKSNFLPFACHLVLFNYVYCRATKLRSYWLVCSNWFIWKYQRQQSTRWFIWQLGASFGICEFGNFNGTLD